MSRVYRIVFAVACLTPAVAISACNQPPASPPAPAPAATPTQTPVERGKMLVTQGACHDCHTTKKPGPKREGGCGG